VALDFGTIAQLRHVNWGTISGDNMGSGTLIAWIYPTNHNGASDQAIFAKGDHIDEFGFGLSWGSGGDIEIKHGRATTELHARSSTNPVSSNSWQCVAAHWNSAGIAGDQELFWGDLSTALAEVGAYSIQQVGAGALTDVTATNLYIGDNPVAGWEHGFAGDIAFVFYSTTYLTLTQMIQIQWRMAAITARERKPICRVMVTQARSQMQP
jgi:hypothetical protein